MDPCHPKLKSIIGSWGLHQVEHFKSTATATLYKCEDKDGKSQLLKFFTELGQRDEVSGKYFFANNSSLCAQLLQENFEAQLLEFVEGRDLYQYSEVGEENTATSIFIDIISRYNLGYDPKLSAVSKVSSLYDVLKQVKPEGKLGCDFRMAQGLAANLASKEVNSILLHGDLHHENVIGDSSKGFLVIDPKGLVGEIEYELGTILKNPWHHPGVSHSATEFDHRLNRLCSELNLDREKVVSYCFVHMCLSISWSIQSNSEFKHQLCVLDLVKNYL